MLSKLSTRKDDEGNTHDDEGRTHRNDGWREEPTGERERHSQLQGYGSKERNAKKNFGNLPIIAIDVAISEKSDKLITFEGDFDWSDIGSFDVLAEILKKKKDSNSKHVSLNSENVFIHSANDKLIVVSGMKDVIVIESSDSILIQKKRAGQIACAICRLKIFLNPSLRFAAIARRDGRCDS